jgi:hypothetical protein
MNTQHPLCALGAPPRTLRFRIEGFDRRLQLLPGNNLIHLIQKYLFAGLLPVFLETAIGKTLLPHQ